MGCRRSPHAHWWSEGAPRPFTTPLESTLAFQFQVEAAAKGARPVTASV